jgi:RNA-directed DNA polymerase
VGKTPPPEQVEGWVISRYFDRFDKSRQDRWVFGNRQRGSFLHKFAWTTIIRHQIVPGRASPDDPFLTELDPATTPSDSADQQHHPQAPPSPGWSCLVCKGTLDAVEGRPQLPQQWEHWLATNRTAIVQTAARTGTSDGADLRLIHANCRHGNSPALLPACPSLGLA